MPKDIQRTHRDTCAPRYIQSMDVSQIPYIDSALPRETAQKPLDLIFPSDLVSLLVSSHPYLPHSLLPTHTLSRPVEYPGYLQLQIVLTSMLLQMLFSPPGTLFPLTSNHNYQLTPPHLQVLAERPFPLGAGSLDSHSTLCTPFTILLP